jgi:hypothetical protein
VKVIAIDRSEEVSVYGPVTVDSDPVNGRFFIEQAGQEGHPDALIALDREQAQQVLCALDLLLGDDDDLEVGATANNLPA